jgi:hypothetical protein
MSSRSFRTIKLPLCTTKEWSLVLGLAAASTVAMSRNSRRGGGLLLGQLPSRERCRSSRSARRRSPWTSAIYPATTGPQGHGVAPVPWLWSSGRPARRSAAGKGVVGSTGTDQEMLVSAEHGGP